MRAWLLPRVVPGLVLLFTVGLLAAGPWALGRLRAADAAWRGAPEEEALLCSYKLRTGQPCLGCGGTRAFRLTAQGEWGSAFAANRLGAFTGASLWVLAAVAAWSLGRGKSRALLGAAGACAAVLLAVLLFESVRFLRSAPADAARAGVLAAVPQRTVK
jgi:hypothetical protein